MSQQHIGHQHGHGTHQKACFSAQCHAGDDDHMEFPEGFYSVKDTVKDIAAIRGGKLIVELLANIGAFGPIVAIKTMQPPVPLMDFLPAVGNLPAGGMSYINSQLNLIPKE